MTSFAAPSSSPTTESAATESVTCSPALVRFTITGLLATIDSYRAGVLPLHRFAWELASRIDTFAALDRPSRVVTRLRWLQRTVAHLDAELASRADTADRAELSGDEENSLAVILTSLRTVLATLGPDSPLDPAGAARPSALTNLTPLRLVA